MADQDYEDFDELDEELAAAAEDQVEEDPAATAGEPATAPATSVAATPPQAIKGLSEEELHRQMRLRAPEYEERVREIAALLIANGNVRKDQFRDLLYDDVLRALIEERLHSVGLRLLHNVYSEYWAVGLDERSSADDRLEWSNNFGLERGAMALLLIVWCKLVLPKRLAQEERQPQDGSVASLFPEMEILPNPKINISRDQIVAEFGDLLGGVTMTNKYLAQLARAGLIKAHSGIVEEGPLLSLVIDEAQLGDELRREVLLSVLRREGRVRSQNGEARPAAADANPALTADEL